MIITQACMIPEGEGYPLQGATTREIPPLEEGDIIKM